MTENQHDTGADRIRDTGPVNAAIGLLGLAVTGTGLWLALSQADTVITKILAGIGVGAAALAVAAAVLSGLLSLTRRRSTGGTAAAGLLSVCGLLLITASGLVVASGRTAPGPAWTPGTPQISAQTTGQGDPGGVTVQVVMPGLDPGRPMDVELDGYAFDGTKLILGRSLAPAGADGIARTTLAATSESGKLTVEVSIPGRICSQDLPLHDADAAVPALRCRDN
ncbi:hypothetical protein GCM10010168_61240 [Actinoplanes ianthinogenes]|uniref:Uncharacterized protein n=1 Tax=Actinoplanes ianthinogenes TaxID=122358 RepID=A0ABN6CMU6_9ACTN|nr:hypothetical protein [Actinoplanes ianthinogenes]BCJ46485.1 hypothetical protein Aiant_71420 [Actinoplanes ianthinogenes]GGR34574.1 hypothetical protein GCM10010168_61240 [Actinoplanes ianthinogenes]